MLKINKQNVPPILTKEKDKWTKELLELINKGAEVSKSISSRYNHLEVKTALRNECCKKCMYCESYVEAIAHGHIEHIKPKAREKYPQLSFEYSNLGWACPKCNINKSDEFDDKLPFINPYIDEPGNHFYPFGVFIWAKEGDDRAKLTEVQIELNRNELLEARTERIKTIKLMIDTYKNISNITIQQAYKAQILKEVEPNKPYSFICKALISSEGIV